MSATVLPFPKKCRRRVWVHNYRAGDPVPVDVARRRINYPTKEEREDAMRQETSRVTRKGLSAASEKLN